MLVLAPHYFIPAGQKQCRGSSVGYALHKEVTQFACVQNAVYIGLARTIQLLVYTVYIRYF